MKRTGIHLVAWLLAALSAFPLAACAQDVPRGSAMVLPADPVPLVAHTASGDVSFTVEIADEPQEHMAGLMFRQQMADDYGMLFVFPAPRYGSFWMKNTVLPLDIIFIAEDGTVDAIGRGDPLSEAPVNSDGLIRFVLELKAGMAQRTGIEKGTRLSHPLIDGH